MSRAINPETLRRFTDLFRFILPNVTPETKHLLSPGELGIDYSTGVFYFCDPTTLNIRTPNSVEEMNKILDHIDPVTGEVVADKLGRLKIYTRVEDIPGIEDLNTVSIDTIISKMEQPSILYANTHSESYKTLGLPAQDGLLEIIKLNAETVGSHFYTYGTNVEYSGKYNPTDREFLFWARDDDTVVDYCVSTGDGLTQSFNTNCEVEDLHSMTVRMRNDTQPNAQFTINGKGPIQLVDIYGEPIVRLLLRNELIQIIRDEQADTWILADPNKSILYQQVQILDHRLENMQETFINKYKEFTESITKRQDDYEDAMDKKQADYETNINTQFKNFKTDITDQQITFENNIINRQNTFEQTMTNNYNQFHTDFNQRITSVQNYLSSSATNLVVLNKIYTFTEESKLIPVADYDMNSDILLVNYNQTILRPGIDYTIALDSQSISLIHITGKVGDQFQLIITKMNKYDPNEGKEGGTE